MTVPAPENVDRLLATLGLDPTVVVASPDSTLRPGDVEQLAGGGDATVRGGGRRGPAKRDASDAPLLPTITLGEVLGEAGSGPPSADLVIGTRIGKGGMGVVDAAAQRSLGRGVAIKRPLDDAASAALVEEARTMARVEHPNVVPVFALGRDTQGRAVLVMKRIFGASLKQLLRDRAHAAWPRLEVRWGDQERACLGILGEVCDALTLAHSHDIVHRDVKPENVMVGEFGEVYLLDWGIACLAGAPGASESAAGPIVGSPGFMAPEMVLEPATVDARTDVYLLGATLHNILTGTLRHTGTSFGDLLSAAAKSAPVVYGDDVPAALAALANASTSRDRASRPSSAAEFRRALAEHEQHREAFALVRAARDALGKARACGFAGAEGGALLAEASLSMAAARRAFPTFDGLANLAHEHAVAEIERDLEHESAQAARTRLATLSRPEPELEARVSTLERALATARESEEAMRVARAEADTRGSFRLRLVISVIVGGIFAALVVRHAAYDEGSILMRSIVGNDLTVFGLLVVGAVLWRKTLFGNAGNRQLTLLTLGLVCSVTTSNAASYLLGLPSHQGLVLTYLVAAAWWASAAVGMHRAYLFPAGTGLACALVLGALPQFATTIIPIAALSILGTGIVALLYVMRTPS